MLTAHEQATVQAAMDRVIPGAREAGTVHWLTTYLSGTDRIWAKADGSGFVPLGPRLEKVWAPRIARLREVYADGVIDLDARADAAHGRDFVDLDAEQQDGVLRELEAAEDAAAAARPAPTFVVERANSSSFDERTAPFFALLVVHTRQAYYSDPVYGGNADRVGWRTIGFPGPDSMADVVAGRYSTLPWFGEEEPA